MSSIGAIASIKRRLGQLELSHAARAGYFVIRFIERLPVPELAAVTCQDQRFARKPGETEDAFIARVVATVGERGWVLLFEDG